MSVQISVKKRCAEDLIGKKRTVAIVSFLRDSSGKEFKQSCERVLPVISIGKRPGDRVCLYYGETHIEGTSIWMTLGQAFALFPDEDQS
jgi:hypothetical protein